MHFNLGSNLAEISAEYLLLYFKNVELAQKFITRPIFELQTSFAPIWKALIKANPMAVKSN